MKEKLITKSFERLLDKGLHRGFITYEELGKSLGKRTASVENVEKATLIIFEKKVSLVEKKSDFQKPKKRENNQDQSYKVSEKSDDPIRMYLREMGGVELLSREGEIAIAKRIEAGKDVMINGLFQSPIAAKKVFEWKEKIEKNELLVREIIDIDSSYIESEVGEEEPIIKKQKQSEKNATLKKLDKTDKDSSEEKDTKGSEDDKGQEQLEEDEFNPSLAAMKLKLSLK